MEKELAKKEDGFSTYLSAETHAMVDELSDLFDKKFTKSAIIEGCVKYGIRDFCFKTMEFWGIKKTPEFLKEINDYLDRHGIQK